jgi:galactoside 2-L-fucosyltransferase 1/2
VASDDSEWCQKNLLLSPHFNIVLSDDLQKETASKEPSPEFDMAILAKCNHTITDYGTFGFWASFFAGGHTFLPR